MTIPFRIVTPPPTALVNSRFVITPLPFTSSKLEYKDAAVAKPEILALPPRTSRSSVGMVVPIPTKPVGLTIRLSLST